MATRDINFNTLQRGDLAQGTPTAHGREPELFDYALGGLDQVVTDLERKVNLAHKRSKILLDFALHPEKY